ncbi:MAG: DctP family TRAP transporter solute-binding subunit [Bacillota bacterium]
MSKSLRITMFVLVTVLLFTTTMLAAPLEIKLAHEEPGDVETSSSHAAAVAFKNVIETQSNNEITVSIYPGNAMGRQRERLELTQSNIIQVNVASIGGLAQFYSPINAFDLPFAFPNHAVAYRVLDGEFGQNLSAEMETETGLKLLTTSAGDFYVLSNNVRPIKTPEDMEGVSFRTMSVPSHIAMMRALEASATPIDWSELYTSLQTGVVDGQHNPIPIMAIGGLQEVQDYVTLTNHLYGADWWVTSSDFYDSLTSEQQVIFTNAVDAARTVGRGHKVLTGITTYGVEFLEEAGAEVYAPSTEELQMFRDVAIPAVMEAIEEDMGDEGVDFANSLLEAVEQVEAELY